MSKKIVPAQNYYSLFTETRKNKEYSKEFIVEKLRLLKLANKKHAYKIRSLKLAMNVSESSFYIKNEKRKIKETMAWNNENKNFHPNMWDEMWIQSVKSQFLEMIFKSSIECRAIILLAHMIKGHAYRDVEKTRLSDKTNHVENMHYVLESMYRNLYDGFSCAYISGGSREIKILFRDKDGAAIDKAYISKWLEIKW